MALLMLRTAMSTTPRLNSGSRTVRMRWYCRLMAHGLHMQLIADCWSPDVLAAGSGERKASGKGGGAGASNAATWAVSEVVMAVQHRDTPVPYRLSKLTRYLQDTLQPAGNAPPLHGMCSSCRLAHQCTCPLTFTLPHAAQQSGPHAKGTERHVGDCAGCVAVVACVDADETAQQCSLATLATCARMTRSRRAPVAVQPAERPAGHFK